MLAPRIVNHKIYAQMLPYIIPNIDIVNIFQLNSWIIKHTLIKKIESRNHTIFFAISISY